MNNVIKFDKTQSESLSKRYAYISTDDVVEIMSRAGYVPTKVWDKNKSYQRIDFISNQALIVGDTIAKLTWVNSFDGSRSASLLAGAFRVLCENGLTSPIFGDAYTFRHVGFNPERCLEAVIRASKELPLIFRDIDYMKSRQLTMNEAFEFARKALELRFKTKLFSSAEIMQVLQPRRDADKGLDAWTIFNVVQENLIRGLKKADGSILTLRAVNSPKTDAELNKALWSLALSA